MSSCIHIREFELRVTILPIQPREFLNIFCIWLVEAVKQSVHLALYVKLGFFFCF